MRGLSLVVASGDYSSSRYAGLSLSWPLLLQSTGSRRTGSVIVAHGPSCSVACGIFPDQGSNPCPLHWQADSQPLCHQGSPATREALIFFKFFYFYFTFLLFCVFFLVFVLIFVFRHFVCLFYGFFAFYLVCFLFCLVFYFLLLLN